MFPFPACPVTTWKNSVEREQTPCLWAEVLQRNRDWWEYTNTHEEPFQRGTRSFLGLSGDLPVFSQMIGYLCLPCSLREQGKVFAVSFFREGIHLGKWFSLLSNSNTCSHKGSIGLREQWLYLGEHLVVLPQCWLLQSMWPGITPFSFHLHLESFCLLLAPHVQSWGDPFCQKLDF